MLENYVNGIVCIRAIYAYRNNNTKNKAQAIAFFLSPHDTTSVTAQ